MNLDRYLRLSRSHIAAACFAALLLATGIARAQHAPDFEPALASRLQSILDSSRSARGTVGISVAILSPRRGTWLGTSGTSEPDVPLRPDMLLGIGSITKTFTAAAILQMVGEGKIALDDRVVRWLPPMTNVDTNITIRQMLQHTSGIFNYTTHSGFGEYTSADLERFITPEEILQFIGPRRFAPGANWSYSNSNYLLLGMIIETVSGTDYESEIRRRFVTPLGLESISMGYNDELSGEIAHNWTDLDGDGRRDDVAFFPRRSIYSGAWAAGGYFGTAEDLARWARSLYGGDLLSPALLTQMTTFRTLADRSGYGLGTMRSTVAGRTMWGHNGAIIGYGSMMLYNPLDSVAFVSIINQEGDAGEQILAELVAAYYQTSSVREAAGTTADAHGMQILSSHPNPFVSSTTVGYILDRPADVAARIYNVRGELVRSISQTNRAAGSQSLDWDGRDDAGASVADGVYICRIGSELGAVSTMLVKMGR